MKKQLNRINYHTSPLPIKVVQFGGGNFMRGFTDYIIDELNDKTNFAGGIINLKATPSGSSFHQFNEQDNLYTLFTRGIQNKEIVDHYKIISAIQQSLNPFEDNESYYKIAEIDELRFVFSNTTESGIIFDEKIKQLGVHANFPANLTTLLYKRFQFFNGDSSKGLIIIPCELISDNAKILKQNVLKYAQIFNLEDEFITWVNEHNYFYNTLVDRIVPGYPKDKINELEEKTGFNDELMVASEPFLLWVIEADEELNNEIPFNQINEQVILTKDVEAYRTSKVRILNGTHTAMLAISILNDLETVKNAIDNPFINSFIQKVIFNEIIPSLDLNKEQLNEYAQAVLDRFGNPFIKHYLSSIALNSISKFKVRILPTIIEYQNINGILPLNLTFSLACLIQFYQGNWKEKKLPVQDDEKVVSFFNQLWLTNDFDEISKKTLGNIDFWNQDLNDIPNLTQSISLALEIINSTSSIEEAYSKYTQTINSYAK